MDDLLQEFLIETNEGLALADRDVVALEQAPQDKAILSNIFRAVHTIKGTCGFVGLPRLEKVAHAAESLLGKFRSGKLTVTPDAITLVLRALDCIKSIVAGIEAIQAEPAGDDTGLIAALEQWADTSAALVVVPATVEQAAPAQAPTVAMADQSIRVSVETLEQLMTAVGELVLTRNQLLQLARSDQDTAFAEPLQRLHLVTADLQDSVMRARLQPIGAVWQKLPRILRDLAADLGKKIDLVMIGEETALDRQVLELIRDPLTHMVRNAADHGLELPAARVAAGKPAAGTITLSAAQESGYIVITIADDGQGLSLERIKRKAVENGLATTAALAAMSEAQIYKYIFAPGFSTAAAITSVSGRGVGMDVVRTNIEKIGGTIDVASCDGKGSTFTIRIPLTLAIVNVLIVDCAGTRYALPQLAVVELLQAGPASEYRIEYLDTTPVLRLRDRLLPLVSLRGLLQLEPELATETLIIVTQVGLTRCGLIVDRVVDREEIVVKPVAQALRQIALFSGSTILGDGAAIMILDPTAIANRLGAIPAAEELQADSADVGKTSQNAMQLLLFRAGDTALKAIPLLMLDRLEEVDFATVERTGSQAVIHYRGQLLPLLPIVGGVLPQIGRHPVIVVSDQGRSMGLVVDSILDITEQRLTMELAQAQPGLLGRAVIDEQAVEVIDTQHYLALAFADWLTPVELDRLSLLKAMLHPSPAVAAALPS